MTDEVVAAESNQPRPLDFKVFGEPLDRLLIAVGNKLSREWPARYSSIQGARELFIIHMRVARMSYQSALYLGGDLPAEPMVFREHMTAIRAEVGEEDYERARKYVKATGNDFP